MKTIFLFAPDPDASGDGGTPATDNTKLTTTDTVYVSPDGGTTNESFPVPAVEYDFCVDVSNLADLASGPFLVRFTLDNATGGSGNKTFDFTQDAGLDPKQSVKAVVHFGQFTEDDVDYTLSACIFSPSAPEKPINCAGTFGFNPHTSPHNTDSSGSSSGDSSTGDSSSGDSSSGDSSGSDSTTGSDTTDSNKDTSTSDTSEDTPAN